VSNTPRFGFVVEYVADIEAATRFYTGVMGLEAERVHPTYVQFEHFAVATDAPLGGTGERELYWLVEDAENAYDELRKTAEISLPLKQMPYGKVFGVKGASGRPCFLLQLAENRPSEPA
jgi:catechol 2,3-dioxygenase-like lactoylglutathione lyase family enzyme